MTDLADGVVYSRSGLTYQTQLVEERGLLTRLPSSDDERSTVVAVTDEGRAVLATVLPGHREVLQELLFTTPSTGDVNELARILGQAADHLRSIRHVPSHDVDERPK
jgi:DNA-binding MarR family transcriptional regulator